VAESIPDIERRIALQENALSVLLGRNPGRIERGKTLDTLSLPQIPQGIPSDLLLRRPDIRQAEQALIAADARIGVARTRYFPSISLTGVLGFASTSLSRLFDDDSGFWDLGAGAAGPLFTGGRITGDVRQAEARQQQLLNVYLGTIQTAFREVDDSLVTVQKIRELLAVQERHVLALQEYASFAHTRYDAKYVDYIAVLDAERSLFATQLQNVQNRNRLFAAMVNTYKTMGGGWVAEASRRIAVPAQVAQTPAK
jgi:multidrug efflux system outer membrane protein